MIILNKKEEAMRNRKCVLCCFKRFSIPWSDEEGEGVTLRRIVARDLQLRQCDMSQNLMQAK